MIKRCILILLLIAVALPLTAEEMDLIVLLDVSESMFPYFDDTVNFLLKDIVDEHLEYGDGFHLISFASVPEQEIHRVIKTESDIETSLARIMLLHPLGKYTDLISAMNYLYKYVKDLSLSTSKNILILTDGIHDPPPGSQYPAGENGSREKNRTEAVRIAQELKREGWKVRLIEFPRGTSSSSGSSETSGTPGSGEGSSSSASGNSSDNDLYGPLSETLGVDVIPYQKGNGISHTATGAPSLQFPDQLGKVASEFNVPFTVTNYRDEPIIIKLEELRTRNTNVLVSPVQIRVNGKDTSRLNARINLEGYEPGEYALDVELFFSDELRIFPRKGELRFELKQSGIGQIKIPLLIILACIAIVALLILTIIPLRRHIESNADAETTTIIAGRKKSEEISSKNEKENFGISIPPASPAVSSGRKGTSGSAQPRGAHVGKESSLITQAATAANQKGKVPLMEVHSASPGGKIPLSQISTMHTPAHIETRQLGHRPIEFRLSGQNPNNSGRNIRWIGKQPRSLGGGNSFFVIFLVKIPEKIAEVEFSENGLRFTPLIPEFFPGISGQLENCIDRPIKLHTEHGDFTMIFREWISPLERVNRILHLIDTPGIKAEDL